MLKVTRWAHISLEVIGFFALIAALAWGVLYAISRPFKHFTDGDCSPDTEQRIIASPDGQHTVKSFHRSCGSTYDFYFAYLSTGNPNPGYEYEPIIELKNVAPGQASMAWNGSDQLVATYPDTAEVVDAYAKTFGITISLHPLHPHSDTNPK